MSNDFRTYLSQAFDAPQDNRPEPRAEEVINLSEKSILQGNNLTPGEASDTTTNPLSIQNCRSLSKSSENMVKRIVEDQTILIWQAYDAWRQKFPRSHEDESDEQIDETTTHDEDVDDEEDEEDLGESGLRF